MLVTAATRRVARKGGSSPTAKPSATTPRPCRPRATCTRRGGVRRPADCATPPQPTATGPYEHTGAPPAFACIPKEWFGVIPPRATHTSTQRTARSCTHASDGAKSRPIPNGGAQRTDVRAGDRAGCRSPPPDPSVLPGPKPPGRGATLSPDHQRDDAASRAAPSHATAVILPTFIRPAATQHEGPRTQAPGLPDLPLLATPRTSAPTLLTAVRATAKRLSPPRIMGRHMTWFKFLV